LHKVQEGVAVDSHGQVREELGLPIIKGNKIVSERGWRGRGSYNWLDRGDCRDPSITLDGQARVDRKASNGWLPMEGRHLGETNRIRTHTANETVFLSNIHGSIGFVVVPRPTAT
jgi:hypothetical protein